MTGTFCPGDTLVLDSPHTRGIPGLELQEVSYRGPLRGTDRAVVVLDGMQVSVPLEWLSTPTTSERADSDDGGAL